MKGYLIGGLGWYGMRIKKKKKWKKAEELNINK
jgi:hypothetical protein